MKKTVLEQFRNSLITPLPAPSSGHVIENLLTYKLPVKASDIWPYLSDTSRMNKELGFPPRIEKEVNGENFVSTKTLGRTEEWIEKPWVWLEEQELQNHREFISRNRCLQKKIKSTIGYYNLIIIFNPLDKRLSLSSVLIQNVLIKWFCESKNSSVLKRRRCANRGKLL